MTRLHQLYETQGQSPWLDNLQRGWLTTGELARWVERGVRGITSNPTIFQKAIAGSPDYAEQLGELARAGGTVSDAYWELVGRDIADALAVLRPVWEDSSGLDGYVSLEVDPALAHDADATAASARALHERLAAPNLYVKVPATVEGVEAFRRLVAEGRSVNVTLIFSLERYDQVIEAYLAGLEACALADLSAVSSVASFFVSRVDTEVDRRLEEIGGDEALALRGKAAVAQAQLAYALFQRRFAGPRWEALAGRGARVQRPLWASTSTKNAAYPDTLYVDRLIGPDTVNTLPESTLEAFEDHGTVARTVDADPAGAEAVWQALAAVGVDLADVAGRLEREGVSSFAKSFDELIATLNGRIEELGRVQGDRS
ncbi:MAG: transaldolase [Acidimicrobiales bacterium]